MSFLGMRTGFLNLSPWDRGLRILAGALMLTAGWAGWAPEVWGVALKVFGWVPLLTGLVGWCPLYSLAGIRTRRTLAGREVR
jgi:hypothetical protein